MGKAKTKDVKNTLWMGFDTTKRVTFKELAEKIRIKQYWPCSLFFLQNVINSTEIIPPLYNLCLMFKFLIKGFWFSNLGIVTDGIAYSRLDDRVREKICSKCMASYATHMLVSIDYISDVEAKWAETIANLKWFGRWPASYNAGITFERFSAPSAYELIMHYSGVAKLLIKESMKECNLTRDKIEKKIIFPTLDKQFRKWVELSMQKTNQMLPSQRKWSEVYIEVESICHKAYADLLVILNAYQQGLRDQIQVSEKSLMNENIGFLNTPAFQDELISLSDAAEYAGVYKGQISRWADNKKIIDNGKKGRGRRITKSSLFLWIMQRNIIKSQIEKHSGYQEWRDEVESIPDSH